MQLYWWVELEIQDKVRRWESFLFCIQITGEDIEMLSTFAYVIIILFFIYFLE